MFHFKQFSILQENSAMKVGTDGVLLGAWTPIEDVCRVLDIGAGTGLITLMLAQRNPSVLVDAVEVDLEAFKEAKFNFLNSNWSSRLNVYHQDIKTFKPLDLYDLIVSNPPYFSDGHVVKTQRTLARHVDGLSFDTLLNYTSIHLTKKGLCSFVLPYKEHQAFILLAQKYQLFLVKVTHVKGRADVACKRSMLLFSKTKSPLVEDQLIVEIERHVYTEDYISLTQDFYLKM